VAPEVDRADGSPLQYAALEGRPADVSAHLLHGADVNLADRLRDDAAMVSQGARVRGVRRLRNAGPSLPWDLPPLRRYEILFADGTRRVANFHEVDSLLNGRSSPTDFWSTIQEVEKAYSIADTSFVEYPTGKRVPAAGT
jgi:hypothetical protein